jgi:biopolymer transport protein ExbD
MKKIKINHNSEFDLDLAPLLAVMVKLVPVLLVSSAFVQLMVIESQLPQVVQQAITQQEKKANPISIAMEADNKEGIRIIVSEKGQSKTETIPMREGHFDFASLHAKLIEVKRSHPEIFKIEINPDGKVAYKEIVKMMDEARQSRDQNIKFPVFDSKQGKDVTTDYMFPEIVFANMMEG